MRMLNPVHPGHFLRTEIIDAHDLTVTDAARILGVSRPTLSSLLNARADLSGEMALRFEKAFGVDMDTLMRMQNSWNIVRTRRREKEIRVERYQPPAVGLKERLNGTAKASAIRCAQNKSRPSCAKRSVWQRHLSVRFAGV